MATKLNKEQFIELFTEVVKEVTKDLDMEVTRKGVVFETEETPAEEIEKLSPEEKIAKFFTEGVFKKNDQVVKDLGGATASAGGYLIPTEFVAEIIQELNKVTPMRRYATVWSGVGRKGEIPKEATKPSASWGTENAQATQSDPAFGQLTWSLNRIDIFTALSKELFRDTPINITAYIRKAFVDAISELENNAFTNGDGVNKPTGFRTDANIVAVTPKVAGEVGYDDLIAMKYAIPAQYRRTLQFMASTKAIERIRQIKDTTGRPIFDPEKETVLGIPIVENPDIPENLGAGTNETELYLGNFSYYYIFDEMEIEINATTEGEATRRNQIWIAGFKRTDGKLALSTPFAKITGII